MSTSKLKQIQNTWIAIAFLIPLTLLVAIIIQSTIEIQSFNRDYTIRLQNIINIEPRNQPQDNSKTDSLIHKAKAETINPDKLNTEDYICYKFGPACKMALAISQAENGTRQCDRFGVNTNKTLDVGVFQINTVHLKKGYTLNQLADCHTNIDIAYDIYKAQGWKPWVAYQNQSYKRFLR